MSFPVLPTDTTTRSPAELSPPDSSPYAPDAPVPHATATPSPQWSIWALISALCGIVTAVGVGVAMFSSAAAGFLCVAAGPALICGLVGLVTISESNGRLKGRGFAVIGVVMGVMGLFMLTHIMSSQLAAHFKQYPPFSFPSDD
ncbi:MAG TPA: hypothetical protein VH591_03540 [Ktedonobacterales bacterium]